MPQFMNMLMKYVERAVQDDSDTDVSDSLALVGTFALVVYSYAWLGFAFLPMFLYLVSGLLSLSAFE